jgi:putative phage-type endonuclease
MDSIDLVQRSDEWRRARAGSLGASQVQDSIAQTKSGWGASRKNVMAQLIAERLTGEPSESFTSAAMQWGNDIEPMALAAYEFYSGHDVVEVGLVKHPAIEGTHASPDGLVGEYGMVEIKCPNTATHIDTLLSQKIPGKYITQMQWQMACAVRSWCDFVSFDPRMPEEMKMFVQRVERDEQRIDELGEMISQFLAEAEQKITALQEAVS